MSEYTFGCGPHSPHVERFSIADVIEDTCAAQAVVRVSCELLSVTEIRLKSHAEFVDSDETECSVESCSLQSIEGGFIISQSALRALTLDCGVLFVAKAGHSWTTTEVRGDLADQWCLYRIMVD